MKKIVTTLLFIIISNSVLASFIYVPMSYDNQKNHLKAYGIVYFGLEVGLKSKWLLNYDGGAFLIENNKIIEKECKIRGVSYQIISDAKAQIILQEISSPSSNQESVTLEKAPKIAVYSPKDKMPWDDAVTMVLTFAEIPFRVIYDKEVLDDQLLLYEWVHLHHEDFTGQYGRFYGSYRTAPWYIEGKLDAEKQANELGFSKVSQVKLAVTKKIRDYVVGGGFMFAMCLQPIVLIFLYLQRELISLKRCLMEMLQKRIINLKSIIIKHSLSKTLNWLEIQQHMSFLQ